MRSILIPWCNGLNTSIHACMFSLLNRMEDLPNILMHVNEYILECMYACTLVYMYISVTFSRFKKAKSRDPYSQVRNTSEMIGKIRQNTPKIRDHVLCTISLHQTCYTVHSYADPRMLAYFAPLPTSDFNKIHSRQRLYRSDTFGPTYSCIIMHRDMNEYILECMYVCVYVIQKVTLLGQHMHASCHFDHGRNEHIIECMYVCMCVCNSESDTFWPTYACIMI